MDGLPYPTPSNAHEHTQLLIQHGVADKVLQAFHTFYPWAANITAAQCKFWATRYNEEALYAAFYYHEPPPIIEVVIEYPYYYDGENSYPKKHGMVVSTNGAPYILYGGDTLDQTQVVLVAMLCQ